MVRMRDVLKSMHDVKRPGQDGSEPEEHKSSGNLRFPSSSSRPPSASIPFPAEGGQPPTSAEQPASDQPPADSAPSSSAIPSALDRQQPFDTASASAVPVEGDAPKKDSPYHNTIHTIDTFLQLARNEEPFHLDDVEAASKVFVEMLSGSDQLFLQALSARMSMTSMAQHSANVSIVSIKIANGLGYTEQQMVEVGIAGMVHEVGMTRIPDEIINKRGELATSEYERIKQHPLLGRQILEAVRDEFPFLPDVIVQEHERWNGNGYPFGLKENDIHEYAQVLGLADTFVALTHMRHYRDNFIAYKAIQSIIERRNVDFSARMIKALIDVISIFPVHSLVKLNNGSIARVVQTNKKYPVRPVIVLVADAKGNKASKEEIIDLSNEPMIYIVSPVLDEAAYA